MDSLKLAAAVQALRPGALWRLEGDTYDGLVWADQVQPKPTEVEIAGQIASQSSVSAQETSRKSELSADTQTVALLSRLRTATNDQIDAYLAQNVTTLAQARVVLGAVIKIMALFVQTK